MCPGTGTPARTLADHIFTRLIHAGKKRLNFAQNSETKPLNLKNPLKNPKTKQINSFN